MRNKNFLSALLGGAILVTVFAPELFFGKIFFNGDILFGFYPLFSFYKHQILTGQSFLWMRSMVGGFPIYLEPSVGFFSPIHYIIFKYFSLFTAYILVLMVGMTLLITSTYGLARSLRISRAGSFLVACVYTFGYHILTWSNNVFVVNALFSLPLLVLALIKISEGKWYWSVIGGIGVGFALFAGQPQWVLMSFVGGSIYVLYLLWLNKFERSRINLKIISGFILIVLIAAVVAAYQVIPTTTLASLSGRSAGLSLSDAQIGAQTPFDVLRYVLPELNVKYLNSPEPVLYVGIIPLILAIFAVAAAYKEKKVQIATVLFLFGLVTAFVFSPTFWILNKLPFFNYFRDADRWMYVGNLGLVLLAGYGFDLMRSGDISQKIMRTVGIWTKRLLLTLLAITGLGNLVYFFFSNRIIAVLQNYFDRHYYAQTTQLPIEHYHNVIRADLAALFSNISFINPRLVFALMFLALGYVLIKKWQRGDSWASRHFVVLAVGLSIVNIGVLNPNFALITKRSNLEQIPYFASVIQNSGPAHQYRMFNLFGGMAMDQKLRTPYEGEFNYDDETVFSRDQIFTGMNELYDIDSIDGFTNLMSRRNASLLSSIGSEVSPFGARLSDVRESTDAKISVVVGHLSLLSTLNVKYITSAYMLPQSQELKLVAQTNSTRFNIPLYLYENKNVLPRMYFSQSTEVVPENEQVSLGIVFKPDRDFARSTLIECDQCENSGTPSTKDVLNIEEYADGLMQAHTTTHTDRWLVFSESKFPGWHAFIDGTEVPIRYANYIFQGILVPAGEHEIRFTYERLPL